MKKLSLLFFICILSISGTNAQQSVSWNSQADNGNWWNDGKGNKLHWIRSCDGYWIARPDYNTCNSSSTTIGPNNITFDNNSQLSMNVNGAWFQINELTFSTNASSVRTLAADQNGGLSFKGSNSYIKNNSTATHIFSTGIGVDGVDGSKLTVDAAGGGLTFNNPININANSLIFSGNSNVTVNGVLSGTGTLTKNAASTLPNAASTLTFTVANTYTGTTTVNSGTLELKNSLASSTITVKTDATLKISENATINNLTIETGGTLNIAAGKTLTINAGKQVNINGTVNYNTTGKIKLLSDATNGTATLTGDYSGPGEVNQAVTTGRYWYVASPVSSAASTVLGTSVYYYDAAATPSAYATTEALTPGVGYAVSPSGTNFAFSGALNNGAQNATIAYNGNTADAFRGYNLIGNPYPSALNWNNVWAKSENKSAVKSTIWFNANGTFETYNASGSVGVPSDVKGYIPPMQGFWVLATDAASSTTSSNKTLAFDNTMRSHGPETGSNPLRAPQSAASENQLIRLQATNGTATDETVLYFNSHAADTYDNYDSRKMMSDNASQIYTLLNGMPIVINGMNTIPYNTEIPVAFKTVAAGEYTIKASEFSNFTSGESLILTDKTNGTQTDLSVSDYTFTSSIGTDVSRFALTIQRVSTSVEGNNSQNSLQVVQTNGRIQILLPSFESGAVAYVYNNIGQIAAKSDITGTVTTMNQNLPSGVYIVKVMTGTHELTEKIIIK